jgi:ADP-heptose:LPS heptosyltransferase
MRPEETDPHSLKLPLLTDGYASRSKGKVRILRAIDQVLRWLMAGRRRPSAERPPQRILICNFAHIGDVVMATAVIAPLKRQFPGAKIGFLVGSWAAPVVRGHPDVEWVHLFDHWAFQRGGGSRLARLRGALRGWRRVRRELDAISYDLAIDLYWNLHNGLPFLWWTGIAVIVGYASAGFGPLATFAVTLEDAREHALERHARILAAAGVSDISLQTLCPSLPPVSLSGRDVLASRLGETWRGGTPYVVVHPSGSVNAWNMDGWREVIQYLVADGKRVVLTGLGSAEAARTRNLATLSPECGSVADSLSWDEFVAVIAASHAVISVDTAAAHVAGALGRPTVVVMPGIWPYLWRPVGPRVRCLTAPVQCSPCHRNRGCHLMRCVLDVTAPQVIRALEAAVGDTGHAHSQALTGTDMRGR